MSVALYRLYLHPLAKHPGPLLGRITDAYSIYHALHGDRHIDFYRLHKRYGRAFPRPFTSSIDWLVGDIVRYGPNKISVCSVSGIRSIYSSNANVRKSAWHLIFSFVFDVENVFSMLHRAPHAARKRIISQAFNDASITRISEHVVKNAEKLCQKFVEAGSVGKWSRAMDMSQWMGFATLDIICDACFSRSWDLIGHSENRDMLKSFEDGSGLMSVVSNLNIIQYLKKRLTPGRLDLYHGSLSSNRTGHFLENTSKAPGDSRAPQSRSLMNACQMRNPATMTTWSPP